MLYLRLIAL